MQPDMVEPVNVVRQFQTQLLKSVKPPACNEFRFDRDGGADEKLDKASSERSGLHVHASAVPLFPLD